MAEPSPVSRAADRVAIVATLVLPLGLLHAPALAEALIALADLSFLAACAQARDWTWLRRAWVRLALAWWGWLVLCSLPGIGAGGWSSAAQALLVGRFLLFVAALEHRVLRDPRTRRWLAGITAASAAWIALQSALQVATGHNLFGQGRSVDGEITGPFRKPRAAAPLSRLLFPTLLPSVAALLDRGGIGARLLAASLAAGGVAIMVLIGQRMPLLLTGLGLLATALLLPRLRPVMLAAVLAGAALLGASAVVSPPAYHRLVVKFAAQMEHFGSSDYGRLAARAVAIARAHPLLGQGFDGFRHVCADPAYFHGWSAADPDGGGAAMCNIHPHNHYLQAVTDAGVPGLVLFSALVLAWLAGLARGLWARPDPLRVGLFVAALVQEWPIASTSSFTAMEIGGWFFLLLGWGLAEGQGPS